MTTLYVQTWPKVIPPDRSFVRDRHFELVLIENHDARPVRDRLLESDHDGVLMIEWDIALSRDDLRRMVSQIDDLDMDRAGVVAPYRLYVPERWAHGYTGGDGVRRWSEGIRFVDRPSFGCIYIARWTLEQWKPTTPDDRLTDTNFAAWCYQEGEWFAVAENVRPTHLHY